MTPMSNTKMKTRRPAWLPGAVFLAATVVVAAVLGFLIGLRNWSYYLGLALTLVLIAGGAERLWTERKRRAAPSPSRIRGKLKVIRGGKAYDLEKDDSTDNQRYLM